MLIFVFRKAKNISGIEFLVGFESEFILLEDTHPIKAVNQHGWCNSLGLPSGSKESTVLEEIADALEAAGIELQMYHPEGAPGQYEVVTGPLPPLQAVDALIHTRETIFNTASKYGLKATFAPRVFLDNCWSHPLFLPCIILISILQAAVHLMYTSPFMESRPRPRIPI